MAFIIGLLAGTVSTMGYAVIQPRFQDRLKKTDTCGVLYLHGLPGLLGGVAALFAVSGINKGAQIKGIAFAVCFALVTGFVAGRIISLFGARTDPYNDAEEFEIDNSAEALPTPARKRVERVGV